MGSRGSIRRLLTGLLLLALAVAPFAPVAAAPFIHGPSDACGPPTPTEPAVAAAATQGMPGGHGLGTHAVEAAAAKDGAPAVCCAGGGCPMMTGGLPMPGGPAIVAAPAGSAPPAPVAPLEGIATDPGFRPPDRSA